MQPVTPVASYDGRIFAITETSYMNIPVNRRPGKELAYNSGDQPETENNHEQDNISF